MDTINLIFNLHGTIPKWVENQKIQSYEKNFLNSRYRIYVNNDLIVERNWLFDNNIFLRESLWLNCILKEYTLKIEPIVFNLNQIKFFIKNPKVNNKSIDFNPDQLELSFTI